MKTKTFVLFLLITLLLASCNLPILEQPADTDENSPDGDEIPAVPTALDTEPPPATELPEPTMTPEATVTPTIEPSPTAFQAFNAWVWADNVNLRVNPGYLFPVLRVLEEDADFMVLGKAPGGEWLFVQRPDNITGWVYTRLVESDYDLQAVPVIQPDGVQTLTGFVLTADGEPLNGIHFAITQGSGSNAPRNDAITDTAGKFIAFMPADTSGVWNVAYVAIGCTSIVMDADCNTRPEYIGNVEPQWVDVTLPSDQPLQFVWK